MGKRWHAGREQSMGYEVPGEKLQAGGYIFSLPGSALKEFFTIIVIDVFPRPCKMV